jgi:Uncharacterised protein family UPF0547
VTTTRSIFQKVCPGCMANVPLDARDCSCGHQFDHDDTDSNLSSEEIRLRAEELYESYLAARAEQAANAVKAIQAEFARDPANQEKSNRVAAAIGEMQTAEAAWTAQSARVAEMRKTLPPPKPATTPQPSPPAPKKRVAPKTVVTLPVRAARKPAPPVVNVVNTGSARTKRAMKTVAHTIPPKPAMKTVAHTVPPKPIVQSKPKKPEVQPSAAPTLAPVAKKPEVAVPAAQTTTPNYAFRQAQAAKAEKILRAVHTAKSAKPVEKKEEAPVPPPAVQAKAPPVVPAQGKTAPRLYAVNKKECPNCTSSVDIHSNRCRCGYEFSTSEQLIPALSMSDEERAEFAKLFNF